MMYSEQLKYIRLVKNITSLMIKTWLSFCFFEPILIPIDSLYGLCFFQDLLTFFEEVLKC